MRHGIRRPQRSGLLNIEKLLTAEFAEEYREVRGEKQRSRGGKTAIPPMICAPVTGFLQAKFSVKGRSRGVKICKTFAPGLDPLPSGS